MLKRATNKSFIKFGIILESQMIFLRQNQRIRRDAAALIKETMPKTENFVFTTINIKGFYGF